MRLRFVAAALASGALSTCAAASGCSYDWTFTPDAGPGSDGGGAREAGKEGSAPDPPPGSQPCSAKEPTCPLGKYCRFDDRACGETTTTGVCSDPPSSCPTNACGCDGTIKADGCAAAKEGVDVDESGARCKTFSCGQDVCERTAQYCLAADGGLLCEKFTTCGTSAPKCTCPEIADRKCSTCDDNNGAGPTYVKCP